MKIALHRRWHWFWALTWSHLHWYSRGALHLDAWFVLMADELAMEVLHPNEIRIGCRLVPILGSIDREDVARGSTSAFARRSRRHRQ